MCSGTALRNRQIAMTKWAPGILIVLAISQQTIEQSRGLQAILFVGRGVRIPEFFDKTLRFRATDRRLCSKSSVMKIIFNCHVPFMLAHGGGQIQIEQTMAALEKIGVSVEPLRWWDDTQRGDVLQHFGRIPTNILRAAQGKGMKVILADLLTEAGSRSRGRLKLQKVSQRILARVLPRSMVMAFSWDSYVLADACIALTPWEARLMTELFDAPPARVHVVPNGVEDVFLKSPRVERGPWLVCTAVINQRKRVLELAEAAVQAQTPLWIIGKPYAGSDPYSQRFLAFARKHAKMIRYEGPIMDRAKLARAYRGARGFVLLSTIESLSLSALEAAACECPLLLSDLPWARTTFGQGASYCPITSLRKSAPVLKRFYEAAPNLKPPPKPSTWLDVAKELKVIYEQLLKTPSRFSDSGEPHLSPSH
jgi:glycosyltransferase involved in cell wall biosynthesis